MEFILFVLGVAGFLAALRRVMFAALWLLKGSADAFLTREMAKTRAQRGDVTGLAEAQQLHRGARSKRARNALELAFWMAALVVPFLMTHTTTILAVYSTLWLAPRLQRRAA
jgi:hypothetical protein